VPVLIKDGRYQHPSLGLSGITLTANYATEMGLDTNTHGVLITRITPGGAADLAGLRETTQQYTRYNRGVIIFGDVITASMATLCAPTKTSSPTSSIRPK